MHHTSRPPLTPLDAEARAALPTAEACQHLNVQPQTMRSWSSRGDGPLAPIKISGRLHWPTDKLRTLLKVEQA